MPIATKAAHAHPARENIIKVAGRLFAKSGYESTSMSEIAKKAGMEKASLYYHFKDKDQLFAAVMESVWSKMAEYLRKLTSDEKFMKKPSRYVLAYILSHILKMNLKSGLAMVKMEYFHGGAKNSCEDALCHIQEMRLSLREFLKHHKVKHPEIAEQVIVNAIYAYVLHAHQRQNRVSVERYAKYLASLFV